MKKLNVLLLTLAVMLASGGVAIAYDDPGNGIKKHAIGVSQGSAVRVYQLVRFGDQGPDVATLGSTDVVVWDTNSDDGVTIRATTTSGDGAIAGVLATSCQTQDTAGGIDSALGRRNWCYAQVYGQAVAQITAGGAGGAAVGEAFITSTDTGSVTGIQDGANQQNAATMRQVTATGGFFLDSPGATDTEAEVFIRLE